MPVDTGFVPVTVFTSNPSGLSTSTDFTSQASLLPEQPSETNRRTLFPRLASSANNFQANRLSSSKNIFADNAPGNCSDESLADQQSQLFDHYAIDKPTVPMTDHSIKVPTGTNKSLAIESPEMSETITQTSHKTGESGEQMSALMHILYIFGMLITGQLMLWYCHSMHTTPQVVLANGLLVLAQCFIHTLKLP